MELDEKQEKIVENMKRVRQEDYINLRDKINNKLVWIEEEKNKGLKLIQIKNQEIEKLKISIDRLVGAEIALKDLLKSGD